jgi:hypothetical protein
VAEFSLNSYINAIVATAQLEVVQLVTQAIRTADISAGAQAGGPLGVVVRPAAFYEARSAALHAEARIDERQAIYTRHAVRCCEPADHQCKTRRSCEPFCVTDSQQAPTVVHAPPSPIQPPWAVLPWPQNPALSVKVIKLITTRPDNACNGTILDCFI